MLAAHTRRPRRTTGARATAVLAELLTHESAAAAGLGVHRHKNADGYKIDKWGELTLLLVP